MFGSNFAARRGQGYGYNRVMLDGKVIEESDTFQCCHCNDTVFIKPADPSPWCWHCGRQHCKKPKCLICGPFMKKIEREEAVARQKLLLHRACDNV